MHLLMEKQRNRGQDGAGVANVKLDMAPGTKYIHCEKSIAADPWQLKVGLLSLENYGGYESMMGFVCENSTE